MEWRSLEEFPNYQFSDTGLVKKGDKYPLITLNQGYPCVNLSNNLVNKRFAIHRVIAELFIGPRPDGQMVRHLDDDKENNHASNLAYGTHLDNVADATRNGRMAKGDKHGSKTHPEKIKRGDDHYSITNPEKLSRGESHWKSKLTESQVDEIRSYPSYYGSIKFLCKKFDLCQTTISRIRAGTSWKKI